MNFYVVVATARSNILVVKPYMTGVAKIDYSPNVGDRIEHNSIGLAIVKSVEPISDLTTITTDRNLPYILIGTILSIGQQ